MSNTGMSQSTSRYKDTIEALKVIISESLNYPDKREVFVKEGSIELIFGESKFCICYLMLCMIPRAHVQRKGKEL